VGELRVRRAEYIGSSVKLEQCPPPTMPEIAVIGRSNVGKSSLINMLTGRKDLALVSKTPGKLGLRDAAPSAKFACCCQAGALHNTPERVPKRDLQLRGLLSVIVAVRGFRLRLPTKNPSSAPPPLLSHAPQCRGTTSGAACRKDAMHQPFSDQWQLVPSGSARIRVST